MWISEDSWVWSVFAFHCKCLLKFFAVDAFSMFCFTNCILHPFTFFKNNLQYNINNYFSLLQLQWCICLIKLIFALAWGKKSPLMLIILCYIILLQLNFSNKVEPDTGWWKNALSFLIISFSWHILHFCNQFGLCFWENHLSLLSHV